MTIEQATRVVLAVDALVSPIGLASAVRTALIDGCLAGIEREARTEPWLSDATRAREAQERERVDAFYRRAQEQARAEGAAADDARGDTSYPA